MADNENSLKDVGFLNAIGGLYRKLGDSDREVLRNMVNEAFGKEEGPKIFEEAVAEASSDNSANGGCPPECTYVRGLGCVCN